MIVMKFGGSSLADAALLRHVATLVEQAVARAGEAALVVLSAPGDATDGLVAATAHAARGDVAGARSITADLLADAVACATELGLDPAPLVALGAAVDRLLPQLASAPRDRARLTDAVLAHGERISTALLTGVLRGRGGLVAEVDARLVMRTDERFGRARPDRPAIRRAAEHHLLPRLRSGTTLVTQGFVGAASDGATTTLGRGGSDWSAALLAAAVAADELQIWTDVPGVQTADPRIVPDARPLAGLRPAEAAELAAFGARVLHPATLQPAVDAGIPVTVRHTRRPDGRFTRIADDVVRPGLGVAAIASRGPVTVLTMTSRRMLAASGYLSRLFAVFGERGVPVDLITTAEVSVACTVEADAPVGDLVRALDGLAHVGVTTDQAIVAVIGDGLQSTERVLERACGAIGDIEPRMVSFGGNSRNLSFVVPREREADAVRRLHREFFGERATLVTAGADGAGGLA